MNRIILIGNGFDLAHGLKTSYKDFLLNYWMDIDEEAAKIQYRDQLPFEHEFITIDAGGSAQSVTNFTKHYGFTPKHTIITNHRYKSQLFELIQKAFQTKQWVDIETEFYSLLKQLCPNEPRAIQINSYKTPQALNDDLGVIKGKLIDYLKTQEEKITDDIVNEETKNKIFEPFNVQDISNGGQADFSQFIKQRFHDAKNNGMLKSILHKYYHWEGKMSEASDVRDYLLQENMNDKKHEEQIRSKYRLAIPDFFLLPEDILFLNFNYTKTANLYKGSFRLNHIHGKLDNDNNPIIFGYGDEMDEHYKKIADLNDNDYLQNIKSIRYLETDNYRNLLVFIDSAPYQIYIMGHSCGNSDRTLLNTLFEHKNCVSIKPFYHRKDDGTDDYINIVQNISRNFKDATLMRDRVVNKTYCESLPQNPPKAAE